MAKPTSIVYDAWKWLKNRSLPLLIALIALIALHPLLLNEFGASDWVFPLAIALVPLFGLMVLGGWKRALPMIVMFITLVYLAIALYHGDSLMIARSPIAILASAYYGYLIISISTVLLRSNALIDDRVYGGLAVFLLTAFMFATMHRHISAINPDSYWSTVDSKSAPLDWDVALYFSISSITTVGFGDIVARSSWARAVTMLESATGVFITVVFISRLAAVGVPKNTPQHHE